MVEDIWLLYSTFATSDEAISSARSLLEAQLVACANVLAGGVSLYRWEGELKEEAETILIAKTTGGLIEPAMAALRAVHPYDVPCIVCWKLGAGNPAFLKWVADEVMA
jgi:periplasmic divalent cation tolerance protein